ncbi:MAG: protein-(glutamine-N5) methyltransferase, release factor-specific [Blastopirellula sp.]|nr:MAG: protein-(glutamine-N5) methyltransferase, release factor-specific [Blastopirellula sp.]
MTDNEPWTIGRLLKWTTDYLQTQGSDSARLDAELLLASACDCQRIVLYTRFDEVVDDSIRSQFRALVKKRSAGMPVAYLLGFKEFYSLEFKVDQNVLIPRPETEHLVIETLDRLKLYQGDSPARVIDVGTGSGAVAITLAKESPQTELTAVDISKPALNIAHKNAVKHQVQDRIRLLESDLMTNLPEQEQFDFVVSNPPYIGENEKPEMPRDVLDFEPHIALFAEEEGLALIRRLVEESKTRLVPGGWLLMEMGPVISDRAVEIITNSGGYQQIEVVKDLAQLPRILVAQRALN